MIKLTNDEYKVYMNIANNVIPGLTAGKYYAKDFFGSEPTCARVVRRLYEEVVAGNVARVSLVGTKSAEGYHIA